VRMTHRVSGISVPSLASATTRSYPPVNAVGSDARGTEKDVQTGSFRRLMILVLRPDRSGRSVREGP